MFEYWVKKRIGKQSFVYPILRMIYRAIYTPACLYPLIRSQSLITKLLGPRFTRSSTFIEIDITYRCNLGCFNCNKSVGREQAPSNEEMTVEQVQKFVQESVANKIKWNRIHLVGGEPTLHPDFLTILDVLLEYKHSYSPETLILVGTNGYGEKVNEMLKKVPDGIAIGNSSKKSKEQRFHPFNMAPKDSLLYKYADYSNGCTIIEMCGMGLTPYGYYPCIVAGGIDRVFGFDKGKKKLPALDDSMVEQLRVFCPLCGQFRCGSITDKTVMSPTWKVAYQKYKQNGRKNLSLY